MASRIVTELIIVVAKPIVATIRRGKPVAKVCGALVGGAIGISSRMLMVELMPFGILIGALVGATVAAAIFRRPTVPLGARATDAEPFQPGAVLQAWAYNVDKCRTLTVLLESAVYVARDDDVSWSVVIEKLEQETEPAVMASEFVRLDELARVEMKSEGATEIELIYLPAGRTKRCHLSFATIADRDELISMLQQRLGTEIAWTQCPLEMGRAILNPATLAIIVVLAVGGIAWLSAHWTANPPPPPRGEKEQDDLVKLLIWAQPEGILLVGSIVAVAAIAWLVLRIVRPPQIRVLQFREGSAEWQS